MDKYLALQYWFNFRPGNIEQEIFYGLMILLGIFIIDVVVFYILKSKNQRIYYKLWQKLQTFSISNFIIGVFLLFFFYEQLPFLAMRLWLLIWIVAMVIWIVFIFKHLSKIPEIKQNVRNEKEFNKYIP